jgi:hypothetical protein
VGIPTALGGKAEIKKMKKIKPANTKETENGN